MAQVHHLDKYLLGQLASVSLLLFTRKYFFPSNQYITPTNNDQP